MSTHSAAQPVIISKFHRLINCLLISISFWHTASAHDAPKLNGDELKFEGACIAKHAACLYAYYRFNSEDNFSSEKIKYFYIGNAKDLSSYNARADAYLKSGGGYDAVTSATYKSENEWSAIPGTVQCNICLPSNTLIGSRGLFVRLQLSGKFKATPGNFITLGETMPALASGVELRRIVIDSGKSTPIYFEAFTNGKRRFDKIIDATKYYDIDNYYSGRPSSYYSISPIPSWKDVAKLYMDKQSLLSSGHYSMPFRAYENVGSTISELVHWMKTNNILSSSAYTQTLFPVQRINLILAGQKTDCKGAASLLQYALKNIGVSSHLVLISATGEMPRSFVVPNGTWVDHVIVYIPSLDKYVDVTESVLHGTPWQNSADKYRDFISLDTSTGYFRLVQ